MIDRPALPAGVRHGGTVDEAAAWAVNLGDGAV